MALTLTSVSFAFVEYESRRDADDAYHEMHNKRIGRDDVLKIEVCAMPMFLTLFTDNVNSGHVRLRQLLGGSILAVTVPVASVLTDEKDHLLGEVSDRNLPEEENILHAKTTVVTEMIDDEIGILMIAEDPEAQSTENVVPTEKEIVKNEGTIENAETTETNAKNDQMATVNAKVCPIQTLKWKVPKADSRSANDSPAPVAHDELDTAE